MRSEHAWARDGRKQAFCIVRVMLLGLWPSHHARAMMRYAATGSILGFIDWRRVGSPLHGAHRAGLGLCICCSSIIQLNLRQYLGCTAMMTGTIGSSHHSPARCSNGLSIKPDMITTFRINHSFHGRSRKPGKEAFRRRIWSSWEWRSHSVA